jgi:hypothetical protein
LTSNSAKRQPSLLERISGPKAVLLTALVQKGEAAAMRVQESFGDFLNQRVRDLMAARFQLMAAPDAVPEAAWEQFYALVVDLRGSAAMAGRRGLGTVCDSLETLLQEHVRDARAVSVAASHIDALLLLSAGRESESAAQRLTGELERAVARLPRLP